MSWPLTFKDIQSKCAVGKRTKRQSRMSFNIFFRSSIQWYLNGVEITESRSEFKRTDDGSSYKLIISSATIESDGKYSCVIKNDYGKIEDECTVTVNCQPKIRKTLKDTEVNEGDTLTLEVEIYAVPEPKVIW